MDQIRQGDVLLQEVDELKGKKVRLSKDKKTILAYGEVTGHHHRFQGPEVSMFRHGDDASGQVFIRAEKPSTLIHEEHSGITVLGSIYEQAFQVEYTPKEIRRVAD